MANTSETSGEEARPWQSYHTVYTNAKAGMDGVDKERVQRIVYEMSKGSKYFENEERKEGFIKHKIENMRARCAKLGAADLFNYQAVKIHAGNSNLSAKLLTSMKPREARSSGYKNLLRR